jgi:hypothetical protein
MTLHILFNAEKLAHQHEEIFIYHLNKYILQRNLQMKHMWQKHFWIANNF